MANLRITHFILVFFVFASVSQSVPHNYNADYDYSNEDKKPICDETNCKLPDCSCFGSQPDIPMSKRPQFVMLTFDDAITVANINTYRKITKGRNNVKLTFYVCHEYNDYTLTNEMQREGHEIAVHTVSHRSNTDLWRDGTEDYWSKELVGMRKMLETFASINTSENVGHRAPFLQTAGNITFRVLKDKGFLYDSSMPSRSYMDPPIWPYTLDYGYAQDCQIYPCPNEEFKGLWEVPMIQYKRTSTKDGDFFCSMVDACTPQPVTSQDTRDFFMKNFDRHYKSNKAPFPVFLHEGWLRDEERLRGYLQFLDEILKEPDVRVVTVRDVIEYMKSPVSYQSYKPRSTVQASSCVNTETCSYKEPLRFMKICSKCPPFYPWVGTPLGGREPKDFPEH